jgi:hypothetical protein
VLLAPGTGVFVGVLVALELGVFVGTDTVGVVAGAVAVGVDVGTGFEPDIFEMNPSLSPAF